MQYFVISAKLTHHRKSYSMRHIYIIVNTYPYHRTKYISIPLNPKLVPRYIPIMCCVHATCLCFYLPYVLSTILIPVAV